MRKLSVALRQVLVNTPTINSQVTGIFYRLAPQDTPPPYILIQKIWGRDELTFGQEEPGDTVTDGSDIIEAVYLVKAIALPGNSPTMGSQEFADYLMELVASALNKNTVNQRLNFPGWTVDAMWRERTFEYDVAYSDIQVKYDYIQGGEVFAHSGANFRIWLRRL